MSKFHGKGTIVNVLNEDGTGYARKGAVVLSYRQCNEFGDVAYTMGTSSGKIVTAPAALVVLPDPPAKRVRETPDFAAFTRRVMRALSRRIANGDIDALTELEALRDEIDAAMISTVAQLRSEPYSYSWADLGDRLGVTRQSVQQRFAKHMPAGVGRVVGGQPASLR